MTDNAKGRGEFEIIRSLVERWGPRAEGIGDDAAVVRLPRGDALVASVDTAIEGRHFRRDWLSPREIGYRAVAAALSDLAAMAARPHGILVALGLPSAWRDVVLDIADGIGDAADVVNAKIVGGNLSDAAEMSITTTVLGSVFKPLGRDGARAGDVVYVTGRLGGPSQAVADLLAGRVPSAAVRARYARPMPRIAEARWLADRGASAAVDISDGLAGDLGHLADASGVSVEVDVERVPRFDGVSAADAVRSGEEYELVLTGPPDIDVAEFARRFALPLTAIGTVHGGVAGVVLRERGERVANAPGYDHFSS